jgi:hypothetical protein
MKQFVVMGVILILLILGVTAVNRSYINLDHWAKGDLISVTIVHNDCLPTGCSETEKPVYVTDKAVLKQLEAVFFSKITEDFFEYSRLPGNLDVTFEYQWKKIQFNLSVDFDKNEGYFRYPLKERDYKLTFKDIEILKGIVK